MADGSKSSLLTSSVTIAVNVSSFGFTCALRDARARVNIFDESGTAFLAVSASVRFATLTDSTSFNTLV
jgi:hypothetical protein